MVCREVHISYVESMGEQRRGLIPAVVVNSPADELFDGVRSPVLIRISSSCDITVSSQVSVILFVLVNRKSVSGVAFV